MRDEVAFRYHQVLENIAAAARSASRKAEDVQLITVTKGHPPQAIETLYHLGVRHIGENRIDDVARIGVRLEPAVARLDDEAALDPFLADAAQLADHVEERSVEHVSP